MAKDDDVVRLAIEAYVEAQMTRVLLDGLLRLMIRQGLARAELQDVMTAALAAFREGSESGGIQEQAAEELGERLKEQLERLFQN